MESALKVIAVLADITTIVAFLVAIVGILERVLTRPRPSVTANADGHPSTSPSAIVAITNEGGSRRLRHVGLGYAATRGQYGAFGDGIPNWQAELRPGDSALVQIHDPDTHFFSSPPRDNEQRVPLGADMGIAIELSWDGPLLPWRRVSRVVSWPSDARTAGLPPIVLKGRKARAAFKQAWWAPAPLQREGRHES